MIELAPDGCSALRAACAARLEGLLAAAAGPAGGPGARERGRGHGHRASQGGTAEPASVGQPMMPGC